MNVLGIESSCDETGVSVVSMNDNDEVEILSNVVSSSLDLHALYGGVVPEIAARSHIEYIMPAVKSALNQAFPDDNAPWGNIDAISVTKGPGLGGSLLVGVLTARTLALMHNKPLYGINHVMAHPVANFITKGPENFILPSKMPGLPMLALIVSGGHSQLVLFESIFDYTVLGRTGDDAVGEAFDKVAKIVGLPYPGGPSIEKASRDGDSTMYKFPKAHLDNPYDFSFSGLKTAVLRTAQQVIGEDFRFPSTQIANRLNPQQVADIAASFQKVAIETLVDKTIRAYEEHRPNSVVIAGGVAASGALRQELAQRLPIPPVYTDMKLCVDNGAMIAALGFYKLRENMTPDDPFTMDIEPNLSM